MAINSAVSNEQIIAALIQTGTIKAASEAVGLTPRAIYSRMEQGSFQKLYAEAKSDIFRTAVYSINGKLSAAVETIAGIMEDKETSPAIRLQAAQIILTQAVKFSDRLDIVERKAAKSGKRSIYDLELPGEGVDYDDYLRSEAAG